MRQPEGAPAQHQHWVGWRYKAPRPVLHIVLSLPRAAATCPALHLQYYNTEQQTFVTVASAGPNALVAGQLGMRPRQEHPATAEEWRLCWSSRAEPGAGALPPCGRELLACLWVNPAQLAGASGLPPLRVPLAAAASVRRLRVGLLLEHSAPDGPRWEQLDVGALYGGELQLLGQVHLALTRLLITQSQCPRPLVCAHHAIASWLLWITVPRGCNDSRWMW